MFICYYNAFCNNQSRPWGGGLAGVWGLTVNSLKWVPFLTRARARPCAEQTETLASRHDNMTVNPPIALCLLPTSYQILWNGRMCHHLTGMGLLNVSPAAGCATAQILQYTGKKEWRKRPPRLRIHISLHSKSRCEPALCISPLRYDQSVVINSLQPFHDSVLLLCCHCL